MAKSSFQSLSNARVPAPQIASPTNVLPEAGQSWGSYWTVITGMTVLMFIMFLAANGQLTQWLNLFIFTTPTAVSTSGAAASTSQAAGGGSSALGTAVDNATGLPSGTSDAIDSMVKPYASALGLGGLF